MIITAVQRPEVATPTAPAVVGMPGGLGPHRPIGGSHHDRRSLNTGRSRPRDRAAAMNVIFRGVGVTKHAMQKANLDQTEADVHGLISKQTAELEG